MKSPNWVLVVCGTAVSLAFIASVTVLTATGANSDALFQLLTMLSNLVGIIVGGGAWVTASVAAKSAANIEEKQQKGITDAENRD